MSIDLPVVAIGSTDHVLHHNRLRTAYNVATWADDWPGVVGNGVHDDTAGVAAALADAISKKRVLRLGPGRNYKITSSLAPENYCVIEGAGMYSSTITASGCDLLAADSMTGAEISNVKLAATGGHVVNISTLTDTHLYRVKMVSNSTDKSCLRIYGGAVFLRIVDCRVVMPANATAPGFDWYTDDALGGALNENRITETVFWRGKPAIRIVSNRTAGAGHRNYIEAAFEQCSQGWFEGGSLFGSKLELAGYDGGDYQATLVKLYKSPDCPHACEDNKILLTKRVPENGGVGLAAGVYDIDAAGSVRTTVESCLVPFRVDAVTLIKATGATGFNPVQMGGATIET